MTWSADQPGRLIRPSFSPFPSLRVLYHSSATSSNRLVKMMPKIMHINFLLLLVLMTTAIKVAGYQPQRKLLLPQSRTCQSLTHGTSSRIHSALPALKLDAVNEPKISAGIGLVGLSVLLLNRLLLPADAFVVSDGQLRADIVAIFACSALLLNVLSEDDITAREREPVALAGYAFKDPVVSTAVSITVGDESRWLINSIMQHTPATSVAILNDSKLTAVGGVLGLRNARFEEVVVDVPKSPILRKALEQGEETYLPDLQILPGKLEFSYFPINCQSVVVLPLARPFDASSGSGGGYDALVVGTNQAKSLKIRDLTRIRSLAAVLNSARSTGGSS